MFRQMGLQYLPLVQLKLLNSGKKYMIAYCFAPVAGYSSFGSYEGNASNDGPFVYTGFRVKWLLVKGSTYAL